MKRLKGFLKGLSKDCCTNALLVKGLLKKWIHFQVHCSLLEKDDLFEYRRLRIIEESFDKRKSRVRWLPLGDQITIYLHRRMASIRIRNKILSTLTNLYEKLLGTKFGEKKDVAAILAPVSAIVLKRVVSK